MIAKVVIIFATLAVVHATGLVGYGAPLLSAGHYGTISAERTAINHVAAAGPLGYAAPLAYGHGIATAPFVYGHGIATGPLAYGVTPLAYGHGLAASPLAYGHGVYGARYSGLLGLGHGVGIAKAVL